MRRRVLLALSLMVAALTAQVPRGDEYIDSRAKKKAIAKIEKAIADGRHGRLSWLATPRAIVIYSQQSEHEADKDAAAAAARADAQATVEAGFDICERILPPHDKCGERFAIVDQHWSLWQLWSKSEDSDETGPGGPPIQPNAVSADQFAIAQRHGLLMASPAVSIWAIYEKAWFGDSAPAGWFTELAIQRLSVELLARSQVSKKKGDPPPFTKQDARNWSKIAKKSLEAALARLAPEAAERGRKGDVGWPGESALIAMFLGHAQADLKDKFQPAWGGILSNYAQELLQGGSEEDALQAALAGVERKALMDAMLKWAKAKTR